MGSENRPHQIRQSLHLPQEIIEEILAILPVKSLLRFKCVSQPWRRLIGSDRFIKFHLQKSRDDGSFTHWQVIFSHREHGLKQYSMRSYYGETPIDPSPLEDSANNDHPISGHVVGSINGVLCILMKPGCFSLYNPSTRIFYELPKIENATLVHGFGCDETSDAYKVFAVVFDSGNNRIGQLYSSKTNSWKTVVHGLSVSEQNPSGAFACGKIHWLKEGRHHIESFDLKREEFRVLKVPFKPKADVHMWLWGMMGCNLWGRMGCFGVSVHSKETNLTDVWVMKEYGVKESWTEEVRRFPQRKITDRYGSHFYFGSLVSPVLGKQKENIDLSCN